MHLVKQGSAQAKIRIRPKADKVERFAAAELRRYIQRISGAKLPIVRGGRGAGVWIDVKTDPKLNKGETGEEHFVIRCDGQRLVLSGGGGRGTLYAVYDLLKLLGCRWIYPVAREEIVPRRKTIDVGRLDISEQPSLRYRGLFPTPMYQGNLQVILQLVDWMAKNKQNMFLTSPVPYVGADVGPAGDYMFWPAVKKQLYPELRKRGMLLNMGEHDTRGFFDERHFVDHPDWYSLVGNTRVPRQICYSNRGGVAAYARNLIKYVKQNSQEIDILGTWPLDGGNYCECARCRDDDTILNALNHVAREVRKVNPDIPVEYLIYSRTLHVPKRVQLEKNMLVLVCRRELLKPWVQAARRSGAHGAYLFEYYWADNYNRWGNTAIRPREVIEVTRRAEQDGGKGIVVLHIPPANWRRSGFNLYFHALACWNTRVDLTATLKDYCEKSFGPAADAMFDFHNVWLQHEALVCSKIRCWGEVSDKEHARFKTMFARLDKALRAAQRATKSKKLQGRIAAWSLYTRFMQKWLACQHQRQQAQDLHRKLKKKGRAKVLARLAAVKRLETEMMAMCEASDTRDGGTGDGVLESKMYRVRRTGRIEQDVKLYEKVAGRLPRDEQMFQLPAGR